MQKGLAIFLLLLVSGCTYVQAYRDGYEHAQNYRMNLEECQLDANVSLAERFKRLGCRKFLTLHSDFINEPRADVDYCKTNKCLHLHFYKTGYDHASNYPITSIAQCGAESDPYFSVNEYLTHLGCIAYLQEHPEKITPPAADDSTLVRTSPEGLAPIQ